MHGSVWISPLDLFFGLTENYKKKNNSPCGYSMRSPFHPHALHFRILQSEIAFDRSGGASDFMSHIPSALLLCKLTFHIENVFLPSNLIEIPRNILFFKQRMSFEIHTENQRNKFVNLKALCQFSRRLDIITRIFNRRKWRLFCKGQTNVSC